MPNRRLHPRVSMSRNLGASCSAKRWRSAVPHLLTRKVASSSPLSRRSSWRRRSLKDGRGDVDGRDLYKASGPVEARRSIYAWQFRIPRLHQQGKYAQLEIEPSSSSPNRAAHIISSRKCILIYTGSDPNCVASAFEQLGNYRYAPNESVAVQ